MITARKYLVEKMKADGKSADEIYDACMGLRYEEFVTEIHNAENAIERYAKYYHARESECPDSFKYIMLINGWGSPFVALRELLKVIERNEGLLKKKKRETGVKTSYKSRLREMQGLIRSAEVWHGED